MAAYYEMEGVPFKPQAYEKAAMAVEESDREIADIYEEQGVKGLKKMPGVGASIAEHIGELIEKGRFKKYDEMKKKLPVDISELVQIPGVGPKTVKTLYQKLKIKTVKDLEKAAKSGKISKLPHFGKDSELKILRGITFRTTQTGRYLLGTVFPAAMRVRVEMKDSGLFEQLEIAGSFRRMQETVGDLDMLGVSKNPKEAMKFFTKLPEVKEILQHGETKSEIRLENGLQIDLRIVPRESWGAALQYFTGNKAHNIKLRNIAIKKGYKLSEYGIFKGKKQIAGSSEEEVYDALGLDYIQPELRTETGEVEAAQKHQLPDIINYGDVIGDLQTQTNWTDGHDSIEAMAKEAQRLGRKYIAITDHTKGLALTGGNDERALLEQMAEIDKLNRKLKGITILKSAEVNLMKDGSLDIEDNVLAKLDLVGIAVHSHFSLSRSEQTKRILKAISNPYANILFHPTVRLINKREPIDFDFEAVIKAAKENHVALEINAHPYRLDIHDTLIRQAIEAGCKLVINTDSHAIHELSYLHFGEAQARRGWATKEDILNTKPWEKMKKYFKKL